MQTATMPTLADAKYWTLRHTPGIATALTVTVAAMLAAPLIKPVSPLLITMLIGILWRNLLPVPNLLTPGIAFTAKPILRFGIILLGLQIAISDILDLGWITIISIAAAVGVTFLVTTAAGKWLGIGRELCVLIAAGFSICGAAAVAGAKSVSDADEDDTATALGLVVIFGTVMIPLGPALAAMLNLNSEATGLLIGLTTHEVAQVVAAGGIAGGVALSSAIVVKLGRVLLLAPVLSGLSLSSHRHSHPASQSHPPIVPYFVTGFIICVTLRSLEWLPTQAINIATTLQTALLAMAMFALGLNVHLRSIVKLGPKPALLGAIATTTIIAIGIIAVGATTLVQN